jgi:hypothetical protein
MSGFASREAPATDVRERGLGAGIYLAFVPWVLFSVIEQHSTLKFAAVAALVASVAIAVPGMACGRPKVLEVGGVLTFAGFVLVAFKADASTAAAAARYARAIAAGGLAAIAFGSLRFVPFTEQYARELVPRRFWSSASFKRLNRRLTALWGWVFVIMIPAHLVAGTIDTHRANLIFNWVIPVVLIMWAVKRTARLSADTDGEGR